MMKMKDFNILEECRKLRRVQNPPYTCPIEECGKIYQGFCGLQYHLVHANHSVATLKGYFDGLPNISTSAPIKTCHRKRGRYSRLPESVPVVVLSADSADETISEESKYLVSFEFNNKNHHVNIRTPLNIIAKGDHVTSYGEENPLDSLDSMSAKAGDLLSKLPVASFREISSYDILDASSLPNSYIRFIEKSAEELDGEVEYDMDEEDSAWLGIMNESRIKNDLPPVSMESFELLMDRLEKESYFLVQMNKEVDSTLAVIDDEAVCSICLDGECQNSNVILFCDMCNLAVHQDCYGVPYIPEGHWLCRRCLHSPSAPVDCVLCPNNGGAFKQTDRAHWAHVVCALWIPEVRFANTVFLEPIDSIESIPAARWRLTCYICKQRGVGACIQCHKTNCYSAFHVTCAQQAGLHMKMETVRDDNLGALVVQKIAYCDTHAPTDVEKAHFKVEKEASLSPTDKMKTARRVLAKKRSVAPVISIPTIPPERIQEIGALISVPKKAHFIQRLIAYWTLKRQFRNGVPLLRRLQTSHLARRDESKSTERVTDIAELYRQLKYWQTLRQDLERARLLCELVRKREKFKNELIRVKQEYLQMALCPFNSFLLKVINLIKQKDVGEIFIEPVDQNEVPDYGDIVQYPMDLQTMADKVKNFQYHSLDMLESDFNLMISNCLAYNAKHTVFYKSGLRMKEQGAAVIKQAKRELALNKFDPATGFLVGQSPFRKPLNVEVFNENSMVEEVQTVEIDEELAAIGDPNNRMDDNELMCKLLQLLDKSEMLKNSRARMKRVKLIKIQMARIKRRKTLQKKTATPSQSCVVRNEKPSTEFESDESRNESEKLTLNGIDDILSGRGRRKRKEIIPSEEYETPAKKNEFQVSSSREGPFETTPSMIFKRPSNLNTTLSSEKTLSVIIKRRRNRKFTGQLTRTKAVIPNSESFRIYRSSNEMLPESDEDSNYGKSSSGSSCSCSESDSDDSSSSSSSENESNEDDDSKEDNGDSDEDDADDNEDELDDNSHENSDDENKQTKILVKKEFADQSGKNNKPGLDQLQLVWAKCRGFPWFPALIINPDMPKGYVHNGVLIPSPPDDILALAKNSKEPVYLVWFYDAKRSWQWLPRTKLKPLGVSDELDKIKLKEARKPADRKAVKKAYLEALVHKTN